MANQFGAKLGEAIGSALGQIGTAFLLKDEIKKQKKLLNDKMFLETADILRKNNMSFVAEREGDQPIPGMEIFGRPVFKIGGERLQPGRAIALGKKLGIQPTARIEEGKRPPVGDVQRIGPQPPVARAVPPRLSPGQIKQARALELEEKKQTGREALIQKRHEARMKELNKRIEAASKAIAQKLGISQDDKTLRLALSAAKNNQSNWLLNSIFSEGAALQPPTLEEDILKFYNFFKNNFPKAGDLDPEKMKQFADLFKITGIGGGLKQMSLTKQSLKVGKKQPSSFKVGDIKEIQGVKYQRGADGKWRPLKS